MRTHQFGPERTVDRVQKSNIYRSPISSALLRLRRPRPPRPRNPSASIAQVDGSGTAEPRATSEPPATSRSSDLGWITSFRSTPPPQLHESAPAIEHGAPSSASASKLPVRLANL